MDNARGLSRKKLCFCRYMIPLVTVKARALKPNPISEVIRSITTPESIESHRVAISVLRMHARARKGANGRM